MKHNWEYKPFNLIAGTITPRMKLERTAYLQNGTIPVISQEESFISGYWNNPDDITPHSTDVVIFGDHSRVVKYVDCDFVVGADGVKIITPKKCISAKFLYHFLKWYDIPSLGYARHFKLVKEAIYPIPPMEVQKQIVAELDKINEVIADCRELLCNLDALAQSLFYDTFGDPITNPKGWPVKTLGEVGNIERGSGISKKDFVDNGVPCIHYGQLHTSFGPIAKTHISCISDNLIIKPKIAHNGDLIMAITSEDVDGSCKSTAWLGDYDVIVGSDAAILHHKQNGVFLSFYTMTKAFYYEKSKYAKGFKVTHISAKEIASIPIFVPSIQLQEEFAAQVEAIEEQKKAVEATMAELQTLLDSRMDYWFN